MLTRYLTAAAAAAAILIPSAHAAAQARHPRTTVVCRHDQRITVTGRHGFTGFVRNDNFARLPECLTNQNHWPNFTVARSAASSYGPESDAYPEIVYGCEYNACTPHSGLPRRITRLANPRLTWRMKATAPGLWAAGTGLWFARGRYTGGHDKGAEIMIWPTCAGCGIPISGSRQIVTIDGIRWWFIHWRTGVPGTRWNYIQFRAVRHTTTLTGLPLMPFLRRAEQAGLLDRHWYATSFDLGFEIWHGGRGLATTSCWITP